MKTLVFSGVPDLRRRVNLVAATSLISLALQVIINVKSGITLTNAGACLLLLAMHALLLGSLYGALKPGRAYHALGVLSVTLWVLFSLGSYLLLSTGFVTIVCLVALAITNSIEADEIWIISFLLLMSAGTVFVYVRFYAHAAKMTGQLRKGNYVSSEKPEKWAAASAGAAGLVILMMTVLLIKSSTVTEMAQPGNVGLNRYTAQYANLMAGRDGGTATTILRYMTSLCQGVSFWAVYLLLKTFRLNWPGQKKAGKNVNDSGIKTINSGA